MELVGRVDWLAIRILSELTGSAFTQETDLRHVPYLISRSVNIRLDGRFLCLQIKVITVIPLSQPFKFNARIMRYVAFDPPAF